MEKRRIKAATTRKVPIIHTWMLVGISLTLGIAIATSGFAVSVWSLKHEGVRDLHMLNDTMRRMQRVPVMIDVLRISMCRWHFLRRWGISCGV
jgi:hypothetical protein